MFGSEETGNYPYSNLDCCIVSLIWVLWNCTNKKYWLVSFTKASWPRFSKNCPCFLCWSSNFLLRRHRDRICKIFGEFRTGKLSCVISCASPASCQCIAGVERGKPCTSIQSVRSDQREVKYGGLNMKCYLVILIRILSFKNNQKQVKDLQEGIRSAPVNKMERGEGLAYLKNIP